MTSSLKAARSHEYFVPRVLDQLQDIFSSVIKNTSDIVFVKDMQGQYVMANDAAASWLGTTVEVMLGSTDQTLFPVDAARAIQKMDQRILQDRTTLEYEETILLKEETRTLLTKKFPWFDSNNTPVGVIGVCRDITEIKESKAVVEGSEAKALDRLAEIEAVYQTAPIGLAVLDKSLRFRRINQHLADINGKTIEEHLGHSIREIIPDVADKVEPLLRRVLETGIPILDVEIKGKTSSQPGVYRTWLESWYPLRTKNGVVNGINIVCKEITERKQLEQRLSEAAVQLESALIAGSVYTWSWDIPADSVTVNSAFAELFGIEPEDDLTVSLPLASFLQAIHQEDRARVSSEIQQSIDNKEVFISEYRVRTVHDEERWVIARGQPNYNQSESPTSFPGALADITERKQVEEQRDRFFELSRDMLAVANTDGYFIQVNSAWTRVLGYSKKEMLSRPYLEFVHPEDRTVTLEKAELLSKGDPTIDFENRYRRKDGTYCWLEWSVAPVRDQNLLYAVAHDITNRKKVEQEREELLLAAQKARNEAERANRIKDDFLAVLSHELRTPLNPILGWVHMFKQENLSKERFKKGISVVERNAKLQIQLVDDLLDISRILRGKLALEAETIDRKSVV